MEKRQKKILVPVDFTPSSDNAIKVALNFGAMHNSEIILLHVTEPVAPMAEFFSDQSLSEKKKEYAKKMLDKLISTYEEGDISISRMIKEGKPYTAIVDCSEEIQAEMIVMGTWGTHAVDTGMIGSNVNKVIRNSRCPVVTVSRPPEHEEISKILIAVDPSFGIRELRSILEQYHNVYNPTVDLVCIAPDESKLEDLRAYLLKQKETLISQGIKDVTVEARVGGIISEAILEYAREGGHDMIWMETHGRNGLSAWLMGSITEEVLQYSPVPVLSLHPEREKVVREYFHSNLPI